jgi:signal peptidase II
MHIRTQRAVFSLFAFVILFLDQLSKWAITEIFLRPALDESTPPVPGFLTWLAHAPEKLPPVALPVLPFFDLVMVWNKGITFGMFNHETDYGPMILAALALAISLFFFFWLFRTKSPIQGLGIAMVIGGALGNTVDRLRFGAVIDFLDFHALGWHWPAFNLADSCIVVGIALLIGYSILFDRPSVHGQGTQE